MYSLVKSLLAPFLSIIFMMLGSGFFNTFSSIRLEIAGYSVPTIGAVVSSFYIGILIGSLYLNPWIEKKGHTYALLVFAGTSALLSMAQAIWINPFYWGILRCFAGISMAGIFIVIESWLLLESPLKMRGRILSIYLAVLYGSLSAGQFLINLAPVNTSYPFFIATALFFIAILPIFIQKYQQPKMEEGEHLTLLQLFNLSRLGFFGGVISGMLLAAVYGLVPVYGKEIGMKVSQIGTLMAVIICGGMIFQWPFGLWADKKNRQQVLVISAILASLSAGILAILPHRFSFAFLTLAWLFGGFSFTIYPLSMAFTCEKISREQIVSATGGFVLAYGLGAIIGPLLASVAMSSFGVSGLFYFLGTITLILGLGGLKNSNS